jgi:ABC-type glutathione transport system ATPase component
MSTGTGSPATPLLTARGLTVRFGKVTALDGLDLTAPAGQVLAILGPNGAGKTTFVRTVATLVRPSGGELLVRGRDVVTEAGLVRRDIGLAGQFAAVEPAMTGRENLEMTARLFGHGRGAARRAAQAVIGQLSLGRGRGPAHRHLLGRPAPPPRPRRQPRRQRRGCCSWTSRRPAWTRSAGARSGTRSAAWPPAAPTSC